MSLPDVLLVPPGTSPLAHFSTSDASFLRTSTRPQRTKFLWSLALLGSGLCSLLRQKEG